MKIRYLGTAAAEAWPALFCACNACKRAADAKGRNIRTRSQAIIDDKLLIDFPPDTCAHVHSGNLNLANVRTLLITHSHLDHLFADDLRLRTPPYAHAASIEIAENDEDEGGAEDVSDSENTEDENDAKADDEPKPLDPLFVFGTQPTLDKLTKLSEKGIINTVLIEPFVPFEAEGYTITPLPAQHDPKCAPVIFLVDDGKRKLLYAHDTGYFSSEILSYLADNSIYLDILSYDCTGGTAIKGYKNHMGLKTVIELSKELRTIGAVDDSTIQILNHFSHNSKSIYDDILPIAKEAGFLVSFDGMSVSV